MAFELRRRFCQKRCQPSWVSKRCISQKTFGGRQDNVAPIRFAGGDRTRNVDDREGRPVIGTVRAVRRLPDASWPSCRNPTVHIQGAIEQAEAGPAAADQVCMARDDVTMFDELRAIADRRPGRLQADVARLTTELDQARRPWWRRCTVSETSRPYVGEPIPEVEALAAAEAMVRSR